MSNNGAFREADGEAVELDVARKEWIHAARPALLAIAADYGALITYKDLAKEVQAASGIETKMLVMNWIGPVLAGVARDCGERKEPLLMAFCIHSDGTVGAGYGKIVTEVYGSAPEDVEMHAAEERLKAHKQFGAKIPEDGGRPTLPPQVAQRRVTARRAAMAERSRAVCPTCWLEVPASGHCDRCDA